jgi:hypothetical protein
MKLAAFLGSAKQCGRTRVRVQSPRGYELVRAPLAQLDADGIEARVTTDAEPLPAGTFHEYFVFVEDDNGTATDRYGYRVRGGEHPKEEGTHFVEPSQAGSSNAALGHMVKLAVSLAGTVQELAKRIADGDTEAMKELRKTQRQALKSGEADVQREIIAWKREDEKDSRANTRYLLGEAIDFGKMVAGRMSPEAAAAVLGEFKESLSEGQLAKLEELVGAPMLRKLLAASSPAKFTDLCMTLDPEKFQGMGNILDEKQQRLIQGAVAGEMQKRAKTSEAKEAASKTNGAAS